MSIPPDKPTIEYASSRMPEQRRPPFALWLLASILFLAAMCASLLIYVLYWVKIR
jgi:hypothetical protein